MRKFTDVILYMNTICIAKWLFDTNFKYYTVSVCLHDIINMFFHAYICKLFLYR